MKPTNIMAFDKDSMSFVAESLGFKVKGVDQELWRRNKRVTCKSCKVIINKYNIGCFAKGKGKNEINVYCDNVYCDDVFCLASYVATEKI